MKAAYLDAVGPPEVIQYGELPTPEPKAGEIRVRVKAAALNPIDTYIRAGMVNMNLPKPFIPGCDFAGEVDAVGSGVVWFKPGDRVWGSNQGLLGRQGTFAEFCCVGEQWAYPMPGNVTDGPVSARPGQHVVPVPADAPSTPKSMTYPEVAAGALVGITAHLGLFRCAKLEAKEFVFVNGGTGGVGMMVIQMAKAFGARVVTTVGSDEKAALARQLGADNVINYRTDDVAAKVKEATGGAGINVWYETQPPTDLDKTLDLMAPWGRIVVMAGRAARPAFPNGPFYVKGLSLHGFAMFNVPADEQRKCADDMNRWMEAGRLRAVIGETFPLSEAAAAHRLQEENTLKKAGSLTGKIVVLPDGGA